MESISDADHVTYLSVPAQKFKRIIATDEGYLIDLRTKPELTEGIINGSLHYDFFEPDFEFQVAKLDKTKPVFLYCTSGTRSKHAVRTFRRLGFKQVVKLNGGIGAWEAQGLPVTAVNKD